MRLYVRHQLGGTRFVLFLSLLLLLGGVAYYFTLYPERMPAWAAKTTLGRELQTTRVYRWQDAAGVWHVTDQPPANGTPYEVQEYARDTNVLPLPPELQR